VGDIGSIEFVPEDETEKFAIPGPQVGDCRLKSGVQRIGWALFDWRQFGSLESVLETAASKQSSMGMLDRPLRHAKEPKSVLRRLGNRLRRAPRGRVDLLDDISNLGRSHPAQNV
jgi:hypothetical protein